MKRLPLVLAAVLATTLVALVFLNLRGGTAPRIERSMEPAAAVADPQFLRNMGTLLGPPVLEGNRVVGLNNGDEIFPAMLAAIRAARSTITFETYIYWSGQIGREFADALSERARAGVRVHVLLDWVGSEKIEEGLLRRMEASGVRIRRFHPLHWYTLSRINNRTHRKLLVVDGRVGFTGGVGIADPWLGRAQDATHWRDSHYRLEGPAVGQMQSAFMDNWMEAAGEVLHGEGYFPALLPVGGSRAQVLSSSPASGSETVRLMYLLSIAGARRSVRLAASYFVPDDLALRTFVAASRRGVTIEVVVPGPVIDAEIVRRASRARWGALLRAGVRIYEYQPTMFHCKVMIVDDQWVSVGSTNFDDRSFRLNDETNLNVLDASFAATQIDAFEQDKAKSREVTLQAWEHRPWKEKLWERAAALLRSQL